MHMSSSNKDMAIIDFNNGKFFAYIYLNFIANLIYIIDILKSVYELRKSHAALAGRPTTQQLTTKNRRDI